MPLNQTLKKNSSVLWTISIIQDQNPEAQTKSEFAEMAQDVINTPTIANITLCLADNLQRFRLMIEHGITEAQAIDGCQALSERWHQDNTESFIKLKETKNLSILTWEEFMNWPDYGKTIKDVENWYKENRDFRNDVDGRIRQARQSVNPNAKISDPIEQVKLLKSYLFEECAYQKFAASKGFNYEIYKTPMSKAMRRIKNNSDFVPSGLMVETHFTQFDPKPKKQDNASIDSVMQTKSIFSIPTNGSMSKNPQSIMTIDESSMLCSLKAAGFIEKTFQMLPPQHQQKAIDLLLKFTTQEIIPLCYSTNINTLKS